jgi:hypothetical protein
MKRSGSVLLGLAVAALLVPCAAREPVTLATLMAQSEQDAASPGGEAYLKEFFTNPWMLALDSADVQCRAAELRSPSIEDFVIALRIGDNGYPTDALVSPDNEGLKCVADRLKATGFIKPPHDGFAIYMPFKHTEPGSEHAPVAPAPAMNH